ncbi:MAG: type II secretion system F family protein [Candidatus Poseidoniaceae archaeon]|nr:type II secretion system F family protein [Candidatus Poseidoniaceae archaeon]
MARKKKNKIVVKLDFPKNDTTLVKLYALIVISVILGLGSSVMWITNSGFVPTSNGEPMFTNLYCGATAKDPLTGAAMGQHFSTNQKPSYSANNSCAILQDKPDRVTWISDEWNGITKRGKNFDVPGVEKEATGGTVLEQPLWLNCSVTASSPTEYTVAIRNKYSDIIDHFNGTTGKENEKCEILLQTIEPDTRYELVIFSNEEGKYLDDFNFDMTVHYYDGIPTNMNNGSLWIGPSLLGGNIHPLIFLNFFGFTFFFFIFPASYYWEKVQEEVNRVEEKFPDFLRDLAEYWKGGLSMTVAVQTLAMSEYGALNDEVKKMSDQLSWGVKFSDVIIQFANRVGTPLVKRAIALIAEADRAGGKISDILLTAANDSRELKFLEGERKRAIGSYIAVIWTSYFVFLGVIVVLAKVFIPAIAGSNNGDESSGGSTIGNMTIRNIDPLFFVTIFYYGVTMQALGNGTMAGLMATGRFSTGFKHSGYMIVVALLVFNFIAFSPDLIGVTSTPGLNPSSGTFIPSSLYFG